MTSTHGRTLPRRRPRALIAAAVLAAASAAGLAGCHNPPPLDHCNATKSPGHVVIRAVRVPFGVDTWAGCTSRHTATGTTCEWYVAYSSHKVVSAACHTPSQEEVPSSP